MGGVNKDEALKKIKENVSNDKIMLHMIAVSAIMKAMARKLGKDEDLWELAGLLHDIDYEVTRNEPSKHGLEAERILGDSVPPDIIEAIKSHNFENTGYGPRVIWKRP